MRNVSANVFTQINYLDIIDSYTNKTDNRKFKKQTNKRNQKCM